MKRANIKPRGTDHRELLDLISIGPATVRVFKSLGVASVADLARRHPKRLYEELCRLIGERENVCVLDAFSAAVAQARNPRLPVEQCQWWYWSRKRLAQEKRRRKK
jgi:predicted RecB family nuclease